MSIKIVIADDHRILRAGLKTLLGTDPNLDVVGEATSFEETIQRAGELRPDILIMDIGMPGIDGLEALPLVLQAAPDTRVLMLTMHEDSAMVQAYLRAGACRLYHQARRRIRTDRRHLCRLARHDLCAPLIDALAGHAAQGGPARAI